GLADAAVVSDFDAVDRDRGDFGCEATVFLRSTSLGMAGEGEAILNIARDVELTRHPLGGEADIDIVFRRLLIPRRMRKRVEAHHRHARHAFRAASNESVARIHHQHAGGHLHGLDGRAAPAVDGGAGGGFRQARQHADDAANVEPLLTFREGAAPDNIRDLACRNAGARHQFADRMSTEILGPDSGQCTLAREGKGRADIGGDKGFSRHRLIQSKNYSAAMARNGAAFSVIVPIAARYSAMSVAQSSAASGMSVVEPTP